MPAYGDYQNEIYFMGPGGVKPKLPVDFALGAEGAGGDARGRSVLCRGRLRRRAHAGPECNRIRTMGPRAANDGGLFDARSERRSLWPQTALAALHGADRRARHLRAGRPRRSRDGDGVRDHRRAVHRSRRSPTILWRRSPGRSAAARGSSSSIRQPTASSPRASCVAPRRPGSRRSSSRSTPRPGLAAARSQRRQLPPVARPRPRQLLLRSALSRAAGEAARGGPQSGGPARVARLRQAADLGRSSLAPLADQAAARA